jgi:hypothetical protein
MASFTPESAPPPLHPERALVTPIWIAALVLLIVNDHLLKGSGLLPGAVTGKLSDFAGLIVAPVLLASVLRVNDRSRLMACHVAVGIVFAGIQVSVPFADRWSSAMGLLGYPWTITSDPTDLIALPMLAASWWLLLPSMQRPVRVGLQQTAVAGLGAIGLWSTVATSVDDGGEEVDWGDWNETEGEWFADVSGNLVINNANDHDVAIYVRPLRDDVQFDCNVIATQGPARMLPEHAFADAVHWVLPARTNLAIESWSTLGECDAAWVAGEGIPPQLLFWRVSEYPTVILPGQYFDLAELPAAATAVVFDGSGPATWQGGEDFRFTPPTSSPEVPEVCESSESDRIELDPNLPLDRPLELIERDYGPDGCFELELVDDLEPSTTWISYLCVPEHALPFAVGEWIRFRPLGSGWIGVFLLDPISHDDVLDAQGQSLRKSVLIRGATSLSEIEDLFGHELQANPLVECPWQSDDQCASTEQRFAVRVAEQALVVVPGDEPVLFQDPNYEHGFTLVHGRKRAVIDGACGLGDELGLDLDVVVTSIAVAP